MTPSIATCQNSDSIVLVSLTNSEDAINGKYKIKSVDSSSYPLDLILLDRFIVDETKRSTSGFIQLTIQEKKKLQIEVFVGDSLLYQKSIKYKIKNDRVELISQYRLPFVFVLVNGWNKRKSSIGLLSNGNINVNSYNSSLMLLTVIPFFGGSNYVNGLEFEKINGS